MKKQLLHVFNIPLSARLPFFRKYAIFGKIRRFFMNTTKLAPCAHFKAVIVLIAAASLFTMCREAPTTSTAVQPPQPEAEQLEAPTASPDGGLVVSGTEITLSVSSEEEDVEIYYTIGGDVPDTLYIEGGPLPTIQGECTLRAIAKKVGMKDSEELVVAYNAFHRESSANLMDIFRATGTGTSAVSATFSNISAFVKIAQTKEAISDTIYLGDYIDLPSLTVTGYDGITFTNDMSADYGHINYESDTERPATLLRIIVVGINSFNSTDSTNTSYNITDNDDTPHVVFQFQNVPGTQVMNPADYNHPNGTSAGGYKDSLMRKYLVPGNGGPGNFLSGLIAAGVPNNVLWGPKRSIAKAYNDAANADCNIIEDLIWLPTTREIFGAQYDSARSETAANQARLEYYQISTNRVKHNMHDEAYLWWEASPHYFQELPSESPFCIIDESGSATNSVSSNPVGVAPAFCVN
jgi:hypothetical protein